MKSIIMLALFLGVTTYSCSSNDETTTTQQNAMRLASTELTDAEKQDLLFLREEEKLARDVYLYAYEKYQHQIFYNISQSEQTHMNRVLYLLNTYGLQDPAMEEEGVFSNEILQQLYNQLTNQVDISLIEALKVGATVEDLDINDIASFEANTQKTDILNVYSKLTCGSRNHLRSFVMQLERNGTDYTPQYLSQEKYEAIIASSKERCGRNW